MLTSRSNQTISAKASQGTRRGSHKFSVVQPVEGRNADFTTPCFADSIVQGPGVLVFIDDRDFARLGMRSILSDLGQAGYSWEVVPRSKAVAAMELLQPSLVVVGVDSLEDEICGLLQKIRNHHRGARLLLFCRSKRGGVPLAVRRYQADGYLSEEMSCEEICSGIISAMNGVGVEQRASDITSILTDRELTVLDCLRRGLTNPDISKALEISEHTVRTHVVHILRKFSAASRAEAVSYAYQQGYLG